MSCIGENVVVGDMAMLKRTKKRTLRGSKAVQLRISHKPSHSYANV